MGLWDTYQSRINAQGSDRRGAALLREQRRLRVKMPTNLSYHSVLVDGKQQGVAILESDHLNQKTICSLPGEDLPHGGIVEWMGQHWLITEMDANNEVYAKGFMEQCNYLLRWISDRGYIVERWSIVEDGTKYLTGEFGDNNFVITRGDSRISLALPRDSETIRLNRDDRFLIDDYDSPNVLAYRLTKPFKMGWSFAGEGALRFVLQECSVEETDNLDLHIANYYNYFPRKSETVSPSDGSTQTPPKDENGKRVWI